MSYDEIFNGILSYMVTFTEPIRIIKKRFIENFVVAFIYLNFRPLKPTNLNYFNKKVRYFLYFLHAAVCVL